MMSFEVRVLRHRQLEAALSEPADCLPLPPIGCQLVQQLIRVVLILHCGSEWALVERHLARCLGELRSLLLRSFAPCPTTKSAARAVLRSHIADIAGW